MPKKIDLKEGDDILILATEILTKDNVASNGPARNPDSNEVFVEQAAGETLALKGIADYEKNSDARLKIYE